MTDIYSQLAPPRSGEYPDWFKFTNVGDTIEGAVADVRIVQPKTPGDDPYPVIEVQRADGIPFSVGCGAAALYRQVYELRPAVGGYIRITFTGYVGQAKLYDVQYQAPQSQPAPAPAAAPLPQQGFAPQGAPAQPWAQPAAAPAPAPAAPWAPTGP